MYELLYAILLISIFSIIVLKVKFFNLQGIKKIYVLAALYLRIIAGFTMAFIYSDVYIERNDADIYKYFDDSKIMYDALDNNPQDYCQMLFGIHNDNSYFDSTYYANMNNWYREYESVTYNDNHTIIRLNAFFRLFTFGFFSAHTLLFAFLGFFGMISLFKAFSSYFKNRQLLLYIAIFLIPSVVFWSSGALKESVLMFALGIFIYSVHQMLFISFSFTKLLCALLGIFFLFYVKMYVFAVFIPVFIANIWIHRTNNKRPCLKHLIIFSIYLFSGITIAYLAPEYNIFEILVTKQRDFIGLANAENAGSVIEPLNLEPNVFNFALNAPLAILNTLFRPFFSDLTSLLMLPSLFENIIFAILIILCFLFPLKNNNNKRIIYFCLSFSILLFIVIGFTTPVIGASVRYRIPVLPFFTIAMFLIIDFKKIKYLIQKNKS